MRILEGERLKWGYGVAWRNYESMSYEAFPIPLNIIARNIRALYWKLASAAHEQKKWDDIFKSGYEKGYEAGKSYGEHSGHRKGYEQGKKDTEEQFGRAIRNSFSQPAPEALPPITH